MIKAKTQPSYKENKKKRNNGKSLGARMETRTFSRSGKHTADDVKSLQPPGMGFKTHSVQEMWFGVSRSVGARSEILI